MKILLWKGNFRKIYIFSLQQTQIIFYEQITIGTTYLAPKFNPKENKSILKKKLYMMMMMRENYIQFKRKKMMMMMKSSKGWCLKIKKKKKKPKKKKKLTKAQYTFSVSFFSLPLTISVLLHGLLRRKTKKVWCCIVLHSARFHTCTHRLDKS